MSQLDVLLVGIDAGCLGVFDRLDAADRIPNLSGIVSSGTAVPLESQLPPWTPSAWPSLYTGVNPGKHGVYGFTGYDGYDYHVVDRADVKARAVWELLDEHDRASVVVNVPVTHPVDGIEGAIVPGFMGPEDPPTQPPGVLEDVRNAIGEYRVYPEYARDDGDWSDDDKMAEYCRLARMRGEAFRYLADRFDPAFGFVQFQKTDTVFHEFDGDWSKVERIYAATDEQVGEILESCDPDVVFLASDHGIGRYEGEQIHVNTLLQEAGYLETTHGGRGMPSWEPIRERLHAGDDAKERELSPVERAAAGLARVGVTTRRVGTVLETLGLADVAKRNLPDGVVRTGTEQVSFPDSTAYMRARVELGVRLNVAGREPDGVVAPDEYEEVRSTVIDRLSGVETPGGTPAFDRVLPREEVFHGPHLDDAPDVMLVPNEFDHFVSAEPSDDPFQPNRTPWNHKRPGVFAASGDVDTEVRLEGAHLFDVAPTVLAALDVPYGDRMDGRVLPVVEDTGPTSYDAYHTARGQRDSDAVEERLAELGYVEG